MGLVSAGTREVVLHRRGVTNNRQPVGPQPVGPANIHTGECKRRLGVED